MSNKIEVLVAQGLDVPNFFKVVPNFVKDVPNFIKDIPRVPKFVLRWGMTSNHFLRSPKEEMKHEKRDRCPVSSRIGCIKFSHGCT